MFGEWEEKSREPEVLSFSELLIEWKKGEKSKRNNPDTFLSLEKITQPYLFIFVLEKYLTVLYILEYKQHFNKCLKVCIDFLYTLENTFFELLLKTIYFLLIACDKIQALTLVLFSKQLPL